MKSASVSRLVLLPFLFLLIGCSPDTSRQERGEYVDLLNLFEEFRDFAGVDYQQPNFTAAMENKFSELREFQSLLGNFDISSWPVSEQIDFHLVRAEMNGLEFQLRVLRPWVRDPAFYIEGRGGLGRFPELPIGEDYLSEFQSRLIAIPSHYEQARTNLGGGNISEIPGDLAILAIRRFKENDDSFGEFFRQLSEHHPALVADAQRAQAAIDGYLAWLQENRSQMTAPAGVGIENYNWLMKNVYLFPYTWEQIRTIVELEDNRVITFQKLEENRSRNLPPLTPVASSEEYRRSVLNSLENVMGFIQGEEIFTVQDHIVVEDYKQGRL